MKKTITKEEIDKMKPLEAKFEGITCNFDKDYLNNFFPLFNYARNKQELDICMNYLTFYINHCTNKKNISIDNVNIEEFKKHVELQIKNVVLHVNPDMIYLLRNIDTFEEVYSDWSNKKIGYETELDDGTKVIFMDGKTKIFTDRKKPIDINKNRLFQSLIDAGIVYMQ